MMQGLSAARRPRKDIAFAEFLDGRPRRHLTPATRELACMLVEGFDAADATRVSTLATLDEWTGSASAEGPTFRLREGYGAIVEALMTALGENIELKLESVAREIRWRRAAVHVDALQQGRRLAVRARAAIVALPLGVLKQPERTRGAVAFAPALDAKRKAFAGLESGSVLKVVSKFGDAFWEQLDGGRYKRRGIFPRAGRVVPDVLVDAARARARAARVDRGSERRASVGPRRGCDRARSARGLKPVFGARAGGRQAIASRLRSRLAVRPVRARRVLLREGRRPRRARTLAAPLRGTLFFAGEAAAVGGESGPSPARCRAASAPRSRRSPRAAVLAAADAGDLGAATPRGESRVPGRRGPLFEME